MAQPYPKNHQHWKPHINIGAIKIQPFPCYHSPRRYLLCWTLAQQPWTGRGSVANGWSLKSATKTLLKMPLFLKSWFKASSCFDLQKAAEACVQEIGFKKLIMMLVVIKCCFQLPKIVLLPAHCTPVQESAGHCSTLTKRIAAIGKHGRFPGNCERDLYNVLDLPLAPYTLIINNKCFFVQNFVDPLFFSQWFYTFRLKPLLYVYKYM